MNILEVMHDSRTECLSIMTSMTLKEYKEVAHESFANGGNIEGQRNVIRKSTVASKIRKRMINDFSNGALFPPVVLGICLSNTDYELIKNGNFNSVISTIDKKKIAIIDGMQRSNIYFNNYNGNEDRQIRVEFWIATKSVKLLYRMLVLNTGQVPWNTRRQIEVVFGNLSDSILSGIYSRVSEWKDSVVFMGVDDNQRRTQSGKYQEATIIQMYLGFNTRSIKVEVNEELANEFQRFDMIESIDQDENFEIFIDVLTSLIKLDFAFSECKDNAENGQFCNGRDLFTSAPACLGFVVASAEYLLGKAPVERPIEKKQELKEKYNEQIEELLLFLKSRDENVLALETLNNVIDSLSKSRIGDEMRKLFKNAFSEMLKYSYLDELDSLEAFWRE